MPGIQHAVAMNMLYNAVSWRLIYCTIILYLHYILNIILDLCYFLIISCIFVVGQRGYYYNSIEHFTCFVIGTLFNVIQKNGI